MNERVLSFEVGDHPDVEARIAAGHIHIDEGPAGTIRVSIRASNPDRLFVEQYRDHIQIGEEGRLRGNYRIHLEVPTGTDVQCAAASGDVDVRGPVRGVTARSASGDVHIATASGRIELKIASGDAVIGSADGDTRVVTASGNVKIADAAGDVAVVTASGDVDLGTVRGTLNVKTASGSAVVKRYEGDTLIAKSVSGRLDLRIPSGRRVDLDIRTLSGKVTLPSPRAELARAPDREVSVRAKSVSGNISIDRAD